MAESLYIADRKARESVELRAQLQKKQAQKEKEKKEDTLRQLAQQVREERAGLRPGGGGAAAAREDDDDAAERDNLRQERHRERQRDRNIARAAPGDKKYKTFDDFLSTFLFCMKLINNFHWRVELNSIVNGSVILVSRLHWECLLEHPPVAKPCTINVY